LTQWVAALLSLFTQDITIGGTESDYGRGLDEALRILGERSLDDVARPIDVDLRLSIIVSGPEVDTGSDVEGDIHVVRHRTIQGHTIGHVTHDTLCVEAGEVRQIR